MNNKLQLKWKQLKLRNSHYMSTDGWFASIYKPSKIY